MRRSRSAPACLAGLVQALGLLRWVMLVPSLAAMYVAPGASEMRQSIAVALFDAANHYLGMGVGEHLGYFFTAIWTVLASALILGTNRLMAAAGIVIAFGVISGILEPFGVPLTGMINAISYTLGALWTLIFGIIVLRGEAAPEQPDALVDVGLAELSPAGILEDEPEIADQPG